MRYVQKPHVMNPVSNKCLSNQNAVIRLSMNRRHIFCNLEPMFRAIRTLDGYHKIYVNVGACTGRCARGVGEEKPLNLDGAWYLNKMHEARA